jgi:hypothetical protein
MSVVPIFLVHIKAMPNPSESESETIYDKLPVDCWSIIEDILHFDISEYNDTIKLEMRPSKAFICYGDGRLSPCLTQ